MICRYVAMLQMQT